MPGMHPGPPEHRRTWCPVTWNSASGTSHTFLAPVPTPCLDLSLEEPCPTGHHTVTLSEQSPASVETPCPTACPVPAPPGRARVSVSLEATHTQVLLTPGAHPCGPHHVASTTSSRAWRPAQLDQQPHSAHGARAGDISLTLALQGVLWEDLRAALSTPARMSPNPCGALERESEGPPALHWPPPAATPSITHLAVTRSRSQCVRTCSMPP